MTAFCWVFGVVERKRLEAKVIDRVVPAAPALLPLDVARGRAVAPFGAGFIRRAEALRFRSKCIGLWLKGLKRTLSELWRFTHLSDDGAVAKMGHPALWGSNPGLWWVGM